MQHRRSRLSQIDKLQIRVCLWGMWYAITGDMKREAACDLLYHDLEQHRQALTKKGLTSYD